MHIQSAGAAALERFLEVNNLSQAFAARALGVSAVAVFHWLRDGKVPTPENQRAIERWTKGAVAASLWPRAKRAARVEAVVPFGEGEP